MERLIDFVLVSVRLIPYLNGIYEIQPIICVI
jgi:hypothetical protein